MSVIRNRVVVEGRVQGVWFRESTRRVAEDHGVAGWVRNLSDGRLEAVLEGEQPAVTEVTDWMRTGPERATVTGVEVREETPAGLTGFAIKPSDGLG